MTKYAIDFKRNDVATTTRRLIDLPNRVVAGDPYHVTQVRYENSDRSLIAGTWTSSQGEWHAFTDRDEYCVLLSGHVKLISEDGFEQEFRAGDSFLIPNGFRGLWQVLEQTTKHFVIKDYTSD